VCLEPAGLFGFLHLLHTHPSDLSLTSHCSLFGLDGSHRKLMKGDWICLCVCVVIWIFDTYTHVSYCILPFPMLLKLPNYSQYVIQWAWEPRVKVFNAFDKCATQVWMELFMQLILLKPALSVWAESNLITHAALRFYYCNIQPKNSLKWHFLGPTLTNTDCISVLWALYITSYDVVFLSPRVRTLDININTS